MQTERELVRENLKQFGFWGKFSVCFFHMIRGYQSLFESSLMFSVPTETLDRKESPLIPWLNV